MENICLTKGGRCKGTNAQKQHGKSLAYTLKILSTTIFRPVTPDKLDHRPLSRQKSVQISETKLLGILRVASHVVEKKRKLRRQRGKPPQIN
eukprot:637856-Pelagomonas_calceolata.AAC.1